VRIPGSVRRALPGLRRVASRYEPTMWIALVAAALLLQWPLLKGYYCDVDANAELAARYNVDGIPMVLVLDEGGRVVRQASMLSARSAAAMVAFLVDTE